MTQDPKKTLSLLDAYAFASSKGLDDQISEIREMEIEWDLSYTSSVRRGYIIRLFKKNNILDEFINSLWKPGSTAWGERKIEQLLKLADKYENFLSGNSPDDLGDVPEESGSLEFALESHLRDFLAKDLEHIEPGLKLYEENGRGGLEFPVEGGRIDILAIDKDKRLVVIELKLSQGRNKALGQLLYYMGWIDNNMNGKPCRGIIIASEISKELETAVARTVDVSLYNYKMNFSVERIN